MARATVALPAVEARSARTRFVPLALVLVFAFSSADPAPGLNPTCLTHGKEARENGAVVRSARVRLLWHSAPARAAAALLRAALLAAGHRPELVALEYSAASREFCALLDASADHARAASEGIAVVAVAVAAPTERQCEWRERGLEALAAGAARVTPRLHVRLAPPDRAAAADCRSPALLRMRGAPALAALRDCGFLPPGTGGENEKNATVPLYIPEDEWKNETRELSEQLKGARLSFEPVARAWLAGRVAAADRSFLFFDAELWAGERGVSTLPPPPPGPPPPRDSFLVANATVLLKHAPALYLLLVGSFAPRASELRAVLERAAGRSVEDAACETGPAAAGYGRWRAAAARTSMRRAVAVVCDAEPRTGYDRALGYAENHIFNATNLTRLRATLNMQIVYVNCSDPTALAVQMFEWRCSSASWRTVGVAAPADQASMAALTAEIARLPLVAYTPAPAGVRSATGRPEQLARALRRLLAACGWLRLGLVSEDAPLARAVAAALAGGGLLAHEVSAGAPDAAVAELRGRGTQVFLVNCDAAAAASVLAAAARATTPADRHVWIVREYDAADDATAKLAPLSVSFQWRGEEPGVARAPFLRRLEREWRGRAWPRHVASMLDALITIGEGFERLITEYDETLDYPDTEKKLSYFWNGVQARNISGVVEDLKYDERGAVGAPVYVERWDSGRPRRLATWHADEPPARGEACPAAGLPRDGPVRCWAPVGDPYDQRCLDGVLVGGAAALAAALAALGLAAATGRRWLARRDRRLERATTARILAQREAAFAELAPYLVDPAALALGEELGAGRFGRVRRGEVRAGARRRPARTVVAVKTLRAGASPAEESQFLHEARLLAALEHEHVVRFEGVCWEGGPPLLLMELALFGDLLRYLRARRHLAEGAPPGAGEAGPEEADAVSAAALTRLAREAAEALAYLAARGLVHRDVRAANCLVDARRSLKLADFGLARETGAADGEYACRGRALFPVLWMAPESLARGVATAASDAWSFGVLALELVTLGARPFGSAAPEACVRAVLAGGRPPLPRDACAETRALALACWRREPTARPPAARLAAWLARRRTALQPALAPDLEDPDCDSGIGEPELRPRPHDYRAEPKPDAPSRSTRSLSELDHKSGLALFKSGLEFP